MAVVPAHLRATTTGIAEVCWTGANAVGPMVAGLLSDTLGDQVRHRLPTSTFTGWILDRYGKWREWIHTHV